MAEKQPKGVPHYPKEGRFENPGPVVFMARPTHFEMIGPDRLEEWERMITEECGLPLPPSDPRRGMRKDWVRGECISGSNGGWDDSDWWP